MLVGHVPPWLQDFPLQHSSAENAALERHAQQATRISAVCLFNMIFSRVKVILKV
jgi:hypothetical protein